MTGREHGTQAWDQVVAAMNQMIQEGDEDGLPDLIVKTHGGELVDRAAGDRAVFERAATRAMLHIQALAAESLPRSGLPAGLKTRLADDMSDMSLHLLTHENAEPPV